MQPRSPKYQNLLTQAIHTKNFKLINSFLQLEEESKQVPIPRTPVQEAKINPWSLVKTIAIPGKIDYSSVTPEQIHALLNFGINSKKPKNSAPPAYTPANEPAPLTPKSFK